MTTNTYITDIQLQIQAKTPTEAQTKIKQQATDNLTNHPQYKILTHHPPTQTQPNQYQTHITIQTTTQNPQQEKQKILNAATQTYTTNHITITNIQNLTPIH